MSYFIQALTSKYAQFSGRARRSEYWFFTLFYFLTIQIISLATGIIIGITLGAQEISPEKIEQIAAFAGQIINLLLGVGFFIPSLAITSRRLHDIGKSFGWFFIILIPIVGPIILLLFMIRNSEQGDNQYGPNPKISDNMK